MSTFKLSKSITTVSGAEVTDLVLDFDSLTLADLKSANRIAKMIGESNVGGVDNSTFSPRLDPNLRVGIAWVAAIKGTKPQLMADDVLKLSMVDALCLSEEALSNYLFR